MQRNFNNKPKNSGRTQGKRSQPRPAPKRSLTITRGSIASPSRPMAAFTFRSNEDKDRFASSVVNMIKSDHPALTLGESSLAMSMLDPGHSAQSLKNATPFPDGKMGTDVVMLPAQYDVDVTVAAGATVVYLVPPSPTLALMSIGTALGGRCHAWPHAKTVSMPGRWMVEKAISGVRALGKSITATNITPEISRGGICYAAGFNLTTEMKTQVVAENTPRTTDANQPTLMGVPASLAEFLARPGYETFDSKGAYVVGRPLSMEKNCIETTFKQLSSTYVAAVIPDPTDNANVYCVIPSSTNQGDLGAYSKVKWDNAANPTYVADSTVVVNGLVDGFDTFGIAITAPAGNAQTFHIKVHALYELFVEPSASSLVRGTKAIPNEDFAKCLMSGFDRVPRFLPEKYNSFGAIWNWFKQYYQKRGKGTIGPLIKSVPVVGNALEDVLSELTI
jgi:hypothetical protein